MDNRAIESHSSRIRVAKAGALAERSNSLGLHIASRVLILVALVAISWCVMTFTHEVGHMIGGWCCGAHLTDFDLRPWRLPYSFFSPDPHPLITLWSGPILGAVVPILIASVVCRNWAWFIAYFCVLANGSYIAVAWLSGDSQLDTTKLLENGAHPLLILVYCIVTIFVGYVGFRRQYIRLLTFAANAPSGAPSGASDSDSNVA